MKLKIISLVAFLLFTLSRCASVENRKNETANSSKMSEVSQVANEPIKDYAKVNGIKMYYEIHGPEAELPLVLIHGGGSTIDSAFSKFLPVISKTRRVIAIEEQGHGRTEGRPGAVSFTQTADDVAALLKHLKIQRADIFGFSNGASSGLQVAIRHPELVRKLIFASSFTKRSGTIDGFWGNFKSSQKCMMPEVLKESFLKVNSNKDLLQAMCEKDLARIKSFKDTSDKDLKKVTAPTLILMGDRDIVTAKHGQELTKLLPNARLSILPGDHGSYFGDVAGSPSNPEIIEITAKLVDTFLNMNQ